MRLLEYKSFKISFTFITLILLLFIISSVLYFGSYNNAGGKPVEAAIARASGGQTIAPTNTSYQKVGCRLVLYADDTWGKPGVATYGSIPLFTANSTSVTAGWRCFKYETGEDSVFSKSGYTWSSGAPSSFTVRYKSGTSSSSTYYETLWSQIQSGSYSTRTIYRDGDYLNFYSDGSTRFEFNCPASTSSVMYTFYVFYLYSLQSSYFTYATYTLKYNPNGGTVSPTSVSVTYKTTNVTPPTPTKEGYSFDGWYIDSTKYTGGIWQYTCQKTAKAKWKSTILLDQQGGGGGSSSVTAIDGEAMPTAIAPTLNGWVFGGYWSEVGGNGTQYYDSNMASTHTNDMVNNTTLYALWTTSITLDQQGGTGGSASVQVTKGISLPEATAPTRSNWTFNGYYTEIGGRGELVYDVNMNTSGAYSSNASTIYACWTSTINLDQQGGTNGSTSVTGTYNLDMPSITVPTRNSYIFGGYFTGIGGTGTQYYTMEALSAHKYDLPSGTTLYVKWTCTVILDQQEGAGGTANVSPIYNSAMPTATAPIRTGWTFGGYYTQVGGGGTQYYTKEMSSANNWSEVTNVTLYAKWTTTVVLNMDGGEGGTTSIIVTYNAPMPSATAPTRSGYTFGGYYTENNGNGTKFYTDEMISAQNWNLSVNSALYAKWTANSYLVTFEYNGATSGNEVSTVYVTYGSFYGALPAPSKAGSAFAGWYTEPEFTNNVTELMAVSTPNNHTLYAKWIAWLELYVVDNTATITAKTTLNTEDETAKVTITPASGYYINEFSFDNVNFYGIKYYNSSISDLAFALSVTYFANTISNKVGFDFKYLDLSYLDTQSINLYLKLSTNANDALKQGGGSVSGVNVSATLGGMASIVGDDFDSLGDDDLITLKADVTLANYEFLYWENSSGVKIGYDESIKIKKSIVFDDVIIAVFAPIVANDNMNGDTGNV